MYIPLPTKQQTTSSLSEKRYYVEVLKEELNYTSTYVPAQLTKDKLLLRHIDTLTNSNIYIDKLDLPTFYWLPKLHKNPYKSHFISNSSHYSTTILSKHIHGEEHVKKLFSTAVIVNEDTHWTFVRGH